MRKPNRFKNHIRGKKAQSVGEQWEYEIELNFRKLHNIILVKQFPKVKFFGRGTAKIIGVGWADYIGMGDGLSFTFDAKTTKNKTSLKLPEKTKHQFVSLKHAATAGIFTFYLIHWRTVNKVSINPVKRQDTWPFYAKIESAEIVVDKEGDHWFKEISKYILESASADKNGD